MSQNNNPTLRQSNPSMIFQTSSQIQQTKPLQNSTTNNQDLAVGSQDATLNLENNYHYPQFPMQVRTELDFGLLTAIQPLLGKQQEYIRQLESEISHLTSRVKQIERDVIREQGKYEKEIDRIQISYADLQRQYQESEVTIKSERSKLNMEKDDLTRLKQIYTAQNETIETQNHLLKNQLQQCELQIQQKDELIKSLRDENSTLAQVQYKLSQEIESLQHKLEKGEQELLKNRDFIHLQAANLNQSESQNQAFKMENRNLQAQIMALQNNFEELALSKRQEVSDLQNEVEQLKEKYRKSQSELNKQTKEYDEMREQRITLQRELREAKQDCQQMMSLLEEQDLKRADNILGGGNIDDRERLLREAEKRLKANQEQYKIDIQALSFKQESLSRFEVELNERLSDYEAQFQKRINKLMEQEKKEHKKHLQILEGQLLDSGKIIAEWKTESERVKNEVSGLKQENRELRSLVERLSDEKKNIYQHLHEENSRLRIMTDNQISFQEEKIRELEQRIKDFENLIEHKDEKLRHFEQRSHELASNTNILEDELNRLKVKYDNLTREKELLQTKHMKELSYWKDRAEEIAEYSTEQIDKYSQKEHQRKLEMRENSNKAYEALAKQEAISNKWRHELEETVKAYEKTMGKLKKEMRKIREQNAILIAKQECRTQSSSPEQEELDLQVA